MSDSMVVLLTGACAAMACALPGTFLVLRGMSLIGDAISHAVLPGIVLAFLVTNSVSTWPVVVGAGAVGLLTVYLIESLYRTRRVKEDASIAVVFPALFALGVLLLVQFAEQKDLDQDCVFYGEIALAPFDLTTIAGLEISRPLLILATVAVLNLGFVLLLYKELKISTFDGAMAASVGISPVLVHYLLMSTVSFTTVASFESVGAILVVAFLIVPAATAHLLTDRLGPMLLLAVLIGVSSSAIGYGVAMAIEDVSIAGCMASVMGAVFVLVWLFAPREGILGRMILRRRTRERFALALVLEHLGRAPATATTMVTDLAWPPERIEEVVQTLRRNGLVMQEGDRLHPTPAGLEFARTVVG